MTDLNASARGTYRATYAKANCSKAQAWASLQLQQIPGCPKRATPWGWRWPWRAAHTATEWAWIYPVPNEYGRLVRAAEGR